MVVQLPNPLLESSNEKERFIATMLAFLKLLMKCAVLTEFLNDKISDAEFSKLTSKQKMPQTIDSVESSIINAIGDGVQISRGNRVSKFTKKANDLASKYKTVFDKI